MSGEAVKVEAEIVWNGIPEYTAKSNVLADTIKRRALEKIAELARARVAVDTGETRDSIQVNEAGDGVEVGGAGLFLEYGTVYMGPEPFLGVSAEEVKQRFALELAASLNGL